MSTDYINSLEHLKRLYPLGSLVNLVTYCRLAALSDSRQVTGWTCPYFLASDYFIIIGYIHSNGSDEYNLYLLLKGKVYATVASFHTTLLANVKFLCKGI